jgi:YgiT-type zinc finger domain-containing protein
MTNNQLCTICGSQLIEKTVDYIDRSNGHFLIVRDVPVKECVDNGHQFFHASVAKKIERLFELDRQNALSPKEVVSVPVVELDMAGSP